MLFYKRANILYNEFELEYQTMFPLYEFAKDKEGLIIQNQPEEDKSALKNVEHPKLVPNEDVKNQSNDKNNSFEKMIHGKKDGKKLLEKEEEVIEKALKEEMEKIAREDELKDQIAKITKERELKNEEEKIKEKNKLKEMKDKLAKEAEEKNRIAEEKERIAKENEIREKELKDKEKKAKEEMERQAKEKELKDNIEKVKKKMMAKGSTGIDKEWNDPDKIKEKLKCDENNSKLLKELKPLLKEKDNVDPRNLKNLPANMCPICFIINASNSRGRCNVCLSPLM